MSRMDPETRYELKLFFAGIAIGLAIGFLGILFLISHNIIHLC